MAGTLICKLRYCQHQQYCRLYQDHMCRRGKHIFQRNLQRNLGREHTAPPVKVAAALRRALPTGKPFPMALATCPPGKALIALCTAEVTADPMPAAACTGFWLATDIPCCAFADDASKTSSQHTGKPWKIPHFQ